MVDDCIPNAVKVVQLNILNLMNRTNIKCEINRCKHHRSFTCSHRFWIKYSLRNTL